MIFLWTVAFGSQCMVTPSTPQDELVAAVVDDPGCLIEDLAELLEKGDYSPQDWLPRDPIESSLEERILDLERLAALARYLDCDQLKYLTDKGIALTEEALGRGSLGNPVYWQWWAGRALIATKVFNGEFQARC